MHGKESEDYLIITHRNGDSYLEGSHVIDWKRNRLFTTRAPARGLRQWLTGLLTSGTYSSYTRVRVQMFVEAHQLDRQMNKRIVLNMLIVPS